MMISWEKLRVHGSILPCLPTAVDSYSRTFSFSPLQSFTINAQAPTPLHDSEH